MFFYYVNSTKKHNQGTQKSLSGFAVSFCDANNELIATGSGFCLYNSQTIVTNYHVVSMTHNISIETSEGNEYDIDYIINYDRNKDLCLLHTLENTGLKPLKSGDSNDIEKGDKVYTIGSPLGLKNTISDGLVSGIVQEGDINAIQISAPIDHGSSGGALFNEQLEVIGVTYSGIDANANLNFAIPIEEVNIINDKEEKNLSVEDFFEEQKQYNLEFLIDTYRIIHFTGEKTEDMLNAEYNLMQYYAGVESAPLKRILSSGTNYDGKDVVAKAYISSYELVGSTYFIYVYDSSEKCTGDVSIDNKVLNSTVYTIQIRTDGPKDGFIYCDLDAYVGQEITIYGTVYSLNGNVGINTRGITIDNK